jgi:hypothetical protein
MKRRVGRIAGMVFSMVSSSLPQAPARINETVPLPQSDPTKVNSL